MKKLLSSLLEKRNLLILGFGKEGQSTFRFIVEQFPGLAISIADHDIHLAEKVSDVFDHPGVKLHLGPDYLDCLEKYQLIIKSPGVGLPEGLKLSPGAILTSQTRLMLKAYHRQIIGITGTKGKSTTTSLTHHLLQTSGLSAILVGNIGRPPFDYIDQIGPATRIIYEMSSHQLEDVMISPHIAVLLNLYPEHLDRYPSLEAYYNAKMRILAGQQSGDTFIYNEDIPGITLRINSISTKRKFLSFSAGYRMNDGCYLAGEQIILCQDGTESGFIRVTGDFPLKGNHNRMNMMAAILAARSAGADDEMIKKGLKSFRGLEHRLEYVGQFNGIHFYNDSIATIPEATMAAVNALPATNTLLLGGFDRMLDYSALIDFLNRSYVMNFIFMGKAGKRMFEAFRIVKNDDKKLLWAESFQDACEQAIRYTEKGKICLLSPAAASYDSFRNFEERGFLFKKLARGE